MTYSEMKQTVNLLANEWNLGKKECGATTNICSWICLFELLEESDVIIKHKDGNKLIGICGYSKNNSKKHLFKKKLYSVIKYFLYKSKDIKDINALKEYYNNYSYLPKELENYFDGEISILIINPQYRGKGIGKKLLFEAFNLAKKDNIKNLQITTDEACNYKFYESCGCEKIYETTVKNLEYEKLGDTLNQLAFVYEKIL